MSSYQVRYRQIVTYSITALLVATLVMRVQSEYEVPDSKPPIFALIGVYSLLFASERWVSHRWPAYRYIYFPVQAAITAGLLFFPEEFDYFAILLIPLTVQAIWTIRRPQAYWWIGGMVVLVFLGFLIGFDLEEGPPMGITYGTVSLFVTIFGITTLRAEEANQKSQALLAELQDAHRKLRDYAYQVEQLTATEERNRLARELHDSVTQTIFSLTLAAQSARILLKRDPNRVEEQLDRMQSLSQNALAEMRTLIGELRPVSLAEEGLVRAIRKHVSQRCSQEGLVVDVEVSGEEHSLQVPTEVAEELFRVVQEALNNVRKHSGTQKARVRIDLAEDPIVIEISDQGTGFDPTKVDTSPTHIGLNSMQERVEALGGRLSIISAPGRGTSVRVENIHLKEVVHA